jgi:hypothetical protein
MIQPLLRFVAASIIVASTLAACGGVQSASFSGNPHRSVALGEWCRTLTDIKCDKHGRCVGPTEDANEACQSQGLSSCMGGHADETPSGHDGRDLKSCADTFESAACDGYMAMVASHTECGSTTSLQ